MADLVQKVMNRSHLHRHLGLDWAQPQAQTLDLALTLHLQQSGPSCLSSGSTLQPARQCCAVAVLPAAPDPDVDAGPLE